MNRITTTSGNPRWITKIEQLYNFWKETFQNFSEQEQNFIRDNIYSFECYFTTKPAIAIRSFLFPILPDMLESERQWNDFVDKILQNFQNTSLENRDDFLEKFYEKILEITKSEPSHSMRTRAVMHNAVEKYL